MEGDTIIPQSDLTPFGVDRKLGPNYRQGTVPGGGGGGSSHPAAPDADAPAPGQSFVQFVENVTGGSHPSDLSQDALTQLAKDYTGSTLESPPPPPDFFNDESTPDPAPQETGYEEVPPQE